MIGTTIGVLGGSWRGVVTPWGSVQLPGGASLDWWVAADDRWHIPAEEASVRQRRVDGTPVVETRLRVPQGDVVQRVWAVADGGGFTVVEYENDSPMPVAVAVGSRALRTLRPPSDMPPQGIDLPPGAAVHPIGHRSTIRLALAHDGSGAGPLPELPGALQVARGWSTQLERAGRLVLPEIDAVEAVVHERAELVLAGLDDPTDDRVGFLLGAHELARLGASADPWMPQLAAAAAEIARSATVDGLAWDADRALDAAADLFAREHEQRASRDLADMRARLGGRTTATLTRPPGVRAIAWMEDRLARPDGAHACCLLPDGIPVAWRGQNFEAYRVPAGPGRSVSFAVRWHAEHPALLWDVDGPAGLELRVGGAGQTWHSAQPAGEALLNAS